MEYKRSMYFFWSFVAVLGSIANTYLAQSLVWGIILMLIYTVSTGTWIGHTLPMRMSTYGRKFWGILILWTIVTLSNVAIYYPYEINLLTSSIVLFIPLIAFIFPPRHEQQLPTLDSYPTERSYFFPVFLFLILHVVLIYTLIARQTTDILPSPWAVLDPSFFLLYAAATALLLWIIVTARRTSHSLILSSLHLFTGFSIAPILYRLGYGFDGFIHRATESWIFQYGFILPKEPFYMGQYGMVVWLSNMSHVPLHIIDVYLVPILASLSIPFVVYYILKHVLKMPSPYAIAATLIVPLLYINALHLTTPHNLALLCLILTAFVLIGYIGDKISWIIPLALGLLTVVTHPLIGAPLFVIVISTLVLKRISNSTLQWFGMIKLTIALALLPVAMFLGHLLLNGYDMPTLINPLTNISKFFDLFAHPHYYQDGAPILFELLYLWKDILIALLVLLGIYGFIAYQGKSRLMYIFPASTIGMTLSAWLLRTWVIFPNVIGNEQTGYPSRLLHAALIFLLPWAAYAIYHIGKKIIDVSKEKIPVQFFKFIFIVFAAFFLMISLYLSYPQRNAKVWYSGFNVTHYDIDAVTTIHEENTKKNYIVLSNAITSVAALDTYSFYSHFMTDQGELFYYAIPTGGPLYAHYQDMVYEGQKREYMIAAMDLMGVDKAYFVVNWYWHDFADIVEGAKQSADNWKSIDDKIYIFTYMR